MRSLCLRRQDPLHAAATLAATAIALMAVLMIPQLAIADPQDAEAAPSMSPASQAANAQEQAEYNGEDFTRPLNLFELRDEYTTAPGSTRPVTTNTLTFRADRRINLAPQWELALRSDLPMVAKNPITSGNPDGEFLYGMGDADVQAALIHDLDARWAVGFGARLIAPTGTNGLGSGKWQLMPGGAVRVMLPEIGPDSYFVPLVRYDVSVAGDPSKKTIGNLQIAPTLNLGLPDHWFVTFYKSPDIRVNYGDPVTGRLFLPFDVMVGRKLTKDWVASLEVSVPMIKDYPVYDFKTEARVHFSY
jgi:hypothetical protein